MASLKTNAKGKERGVLNTTINKETLEKFKAYCKENAYPLNLILECFMEQFVNDEIVIKLGNKIDVK